MIIILNGSIGVGKASVSWRQERDTNCCYAIQDKVCVKDPNGHSWEFFSIKQHLDPVHTLELDAFYMDMYEVTVGQFNKLFVQESGCKLQAVGYRA